MANISYPEILLGFVSFLFLFHWIRNRNSLLINWPVLGMLPGAIWNLWDVHDGVTELLKQSGGTFLFKGPWFCNLDFLLTSDPLNMHHILNKNFPNYPKGPEYSTIFEPLGDGILAADSDSWKFQRKMLHSYLKDAKFQVFLEKTIQEKIVHSLIPILDHVCAQEIEVNMEDVFQRFGLDIIGSLFLGSDPKCLSMGFPKVAYKKAFEDMEEALLYRHILPDKYWKLQKWLQIGLEKKLSTGLKTFDDFAYQRISSKRAKMGEIKINQHNDANFDFLTAYLMEEDAIKDSETVKSNPKFLRDAAANLVAAGSESSSSALSWFFWMLAKHESIERMILEEIKERLPRTKDEKQSYVYSAEEVNKLVYLHAALCETMRLYPPLPINHKCSMLPDTLPSGHRVDANTKIFMSFYAMGKMEEIWGKDCCEFKPERWISKDGRIVHVPSYKFPIFNAGPRSCVGKDMSFVQMKILAVAIIMNYRIQVVEDHPVMSSSCVTLRMKHGFKVKLVKRSVKNICT